MLHASPAQSSISTRLSFFYSQNTGLLSECRLLVVIVAPYTHCIRYVSDMIRRIVRPRYMVILSYSISPFQSHYAFTFSHLFAQIRDRSIVIFSNTNMAPSSWTAILFSVIVVSTFSLSRCQPHASQCNHFYFIPTANTKLSNNSLEQCNLRLTAYTTYESNCRFQRS